MGLGKEKSKMKILHLTLKKKWFDLIAIGEKKEEYRELKKYWGDRLCNNPKQWLDGLKEFDVVQFRNGYTTDAPTITVVCEGIDFGMGKEEWGAEKDKEYFVIKLGELTNKQQTR